MLFSPFLLNILSENFIHVCAVFWSYLPRFPLLFPSHPLWPFSFLQTPPHFCIFAVFVLWLTEFSQADFHEPSFGAFHWDMGDFLWATEDNQSFSPSTYQEVLIPQGWVGPYELLFTDDVTIFRLSIMQVQSRQTDVKFRIAAVMLCLKVSISWPSSPYTPLYSFSFLQCSQWIGWYRYPV